MTTATIAPWEPGVGAWDWMPSAQLDRLWARCAEGAQQPPFAAEPADPDAAGAAAGLSHYAAALHRSGDLVESPRARHFHRVGAAARVVIRVEAGSPWTGALGPSSELHGILRVSSVFGGGDADWQGPDGALPVLGAALKVPVLGAPSLNMLLLQPADGAVRSLDAALALPLWTALPAAEAWPNLSPRQRFAAIENEERAAAALRAVEAPAGQGPTRLPIDRWCRLHPNGARSPDAAAPWALQLRIEPEALAALVATGAPELRARLVRATAAAQPGGPPWARLSWAHEGGPWQTLAKITLETPFLVSPTISERLHFQHDVSAR